MPSQGCVYSWIYPAWIILQRRCQGLLRNESAWKQSLLGRQDLSAFVTMALCHILWHVLELPWTAENCEYQ